MPCHLLGNCRETVGRSAAVVAVWSIDRRGEGAADLARRIWGGAAGAAEDAAKATKEDSN